MLSLGCLFFRHAYRTSFDQALSTNPGVSLVYLTSLPRTCVHHRCLLDHYSLDVGVKGFRNIELKLPFKVYLFWWFGPFSVCMALIPERLMARLATVQGFDVSDQCLVFSCFLSDLLCPYNR